jgi:hypothetical protein
MCLADEEEEAQRVQILEAIEASDIPLRAVWARYFEYTGLVAVFETSAYLEGVMTLPIEECNLLAHAVNELIDEQPLPPRAPHRTTMAGPASVTGLGNPCNADDVVAIDEQLRQWLLGSAPGTVPYR